MDNSEFIEPSRFASVNVDNFIAQNENKNTKRKTVSHMNLLEDFLVTKMSCVTLLTFPLKIWIHCWLNFLCQSVRKMGGNTNRHHCETCFQVSKENLEIVSMERVL